LPIRRWLVTPCYAYPRLLPTQLAGQLSLGLRIVGQLAREWGLKDVGYRARTVWFEVGPIQSPTLVAA
jgi:hypothetical protein